MTRTYQIDAPERQMTKGPHTFSSRAFTGRFVTDSNNVVAQADPMIGWARGKTFDDLKMICHVNRWTLTEIVR